MPLLDITNPEVIKFLVENYDRTTRLRLRWNVQHKDRLKEAAVLKREEKGYFEGDVIKFKMTEGLKALTRDHISGASNRRRPSLRDAAHTPGIADLRKGHSIPEVGLGDPKEDPRLDRPDTDLQPDPLMRPIDPKHKIIIYKDIPVFGREVYLKTRSRTAPDKKYYFPECSSWVYGWRPGDSYFKGASAKYGCVYRLNRDARSRSGPQPDPPHYKAPEVGPPKCNL